MIRARAVPLGASSRLTCAIAVGCLLGTRAALAFPATDESSPSIVANPPQPSESDLRHQLQLQSGFGAAASAGGWTFVPQLGAQEMFTDNVLQSATNRRWDLITVVTPGIAVLGDEPNAQVRLSYTPQLRVDARTPQENGVTQQLLGTGQFTIIPDQLFVDARAIAGATPVASGFGALGGGLSPGISAAAAGVGSGVLPKENQAQNSSMAISPYILHRFGDTGTVKVGYSFTETTISQDGGSLPLFFPSGGASQHLTSNEGVAQFETGEAFAPFRYMVLANVDQSNGTGVSRNSSQDTINNQLGYDVNREWNVFGNLGYENLRYGGVPATKVTDALWGFGATWTPNTDSQVTIGYGHQNGVSGLQFSGYYAFSARSRITARYSTGLQTDLQGLENQLDLAALDQNGNAVDAQTGAPLFNNLSGLGLQRGLYRNKSLIVTATTVLDRDQFSFSAQWSQQTTVATDTAISPTSPLDTVTPPVGSTSQGVTGIFTWTRQISEDLSMTSSGSYGVSSINGGGRSGNTGQQTSLGANVGLQYLISQTLTTSVRYSYFKRGSSLPGQTIYQNLFLVAVNKQF